MKYFDGYQGGAVSFWETFPYFQETDLFRKLYKEDRSKDKNKSSKVMWYLVFVKDIDSEYYSMDESEQKDIIPDVLDIDVEKYIGAEKLDMLLNRFEDFIDTPITADIRASEKKLIERKAFIKDTDYSLDEMIQPEGKGKPYLKKGSAAQLDKMITESGKIHDEIRRLRAAAKSEQAEKGKGGKTDSFMEGH